MNAIIFVLVNALAVFVSSYILPGVKVDSFLTAVVVAVLLGVLNTFAKPVLIILTLPINILTLFLFVFVINAFLVLFTSSLVPGFHVAGFWWALVFSLVLSIVTSFLNSLVKI